MKKIYIVICNYIHIMYNIVINNLYIKSKLSQQTHPRVSSRKTNAQREHGQRGSACHAHQTKCHLENTEIIVGDEVNLYNVLKILSTRYFRLS